LKINKPEDVIDYLLTNSGQHAYNNNEVFEALSRLINTSNKTAEEIISYLDLGAGKNLLALWILLGGMMIVLIFLLYRRKKKEESSQQ
jgi:LPXTG-motif cell wall-anchored protein